MNDLDDLRRRLHNGQLPKIDLEWFMNLSDSSLLNIACMEATYDMSHASLEEFQKRRRIICDLLMAMVRRIENKL